MTSMTGPQHVMTASTSDGTLTVRQCTCSYTWGTGDLGHVTEVRRPGAACPVHPAGHLTAQAALIPCAGTPYRCDGFDPADWPGSDVPAGVHEIAAILARNSAREQGG